MEELVHLSDILSLWEKKISNFNHDRILNMLRCGEYNPEHMTVDREDPHESLLACRLVPHPTGEQEGEQEEEEEEEEEGEEEDAVAREKAHAEDLSVRRDAGEEMDQVGKHVDEVEKKLKVLQGRLLKCPLESMRISREIIKETPTYANPTTVARSVKHNGPFNPQDLILTISVHSMSRPGTASQTFEVRANQRLSDLRDRMSCLTDRVLVELNEHGTAPKDHLPLPQPKSHGTAAHMTICPSSAYFLIEGTFYTDVKPNLEPEDPTQRVRDWIAMDKPRRYYFDPIVTDHAISMRDTRWINLSLRVNRPYSAVHCGKCDHYFVVERIRLEHEYDQFPSDPLNPPSLPDAPAAGIREVYRMRKRRRKCRFCDIGKVAWVTVNDRLAPDNPCWFCDVCYRSMHYDQKGELIYNDYRVYPYFHDFY